MNKLLIISIALACASLVLCQPAPGTTRIQPFVVHGNSNFSVSYSAAQRIFRYAFNPHNPLQDWRINPVNSSAILPPAANQPLALIIFNPAMNQFVSWTPATGLNLTATQPRENYFNAVRNNMASQMRTGLNVYTLRANVKYANGSDACLDSNPVGAHVGSLAGLRVTVCSMFLPVTPGLSSTGGYTDMFQWWYFNITAPARS